MSPLSMEMNVNKVSGSNRMWQGHEEVDVIAPCKEKLQMLLSCCQDVAQIVETLEAHMQSSRPKESTAMLEVDTTRTEISLLRDELRRSKLYNEELEVANMSLEKKAAEMEEKVQALTAQLMVYKEDFDLERQDRERAQGKLIEFEHQLLFYQRPYESYVPRSTLAPRAANAQSSGSHQHFHPYLSNELIARGTDVCDYYETDGVADDRTIGERPVMPYTVTDAANEQDATLDRDCCPSLELKAQSFNILDFFPATANAEKSIDAISPKSLDGGHKVVAEDGRDATERDTLCTDGVELPLPNAGASTRGKSVASPPNKPPVHQYKPQQDWYHPTSWSFLTQDQPDTMHGNLNLYQTDSSHLLPENNLEDSQLMCPKCHMCFSCSDHLLLLDHLEEC